MSSRSPRVGFTSAAGNKVIRRKLETVGDVYDLLVQQAGSHRMEALEVTVVVLDRRRDSCWRSCGIETSHAANRSMMKMGEFFAFNRTGTARSFLIAGQIARANQEENEAHQENGHDREHGDGEVRPLHRGGSDGDEKLADR